MKAVIRGIASAVVKAPWVLIALALALTVVFGLVSAGADRTTGQEGFAPDNPEIDASNTIQELFGADAAESVMQVIVRSESGDVLTAEALGSVNAAIGNLLSGEAGETLSVRPERPQPVFSFLAPVQFAAEAQGIPLDGLSDDQVKQIYEQTLADPQAEAQLGFARQLVADKDEDGRYEAGLMLVFVESVDGDGDGALDAQIEREKAVAAALSDVDLPEGLEIRPFSFGLLFGEDVGFESELGRLFGSAFAIIIAILIFVYWMRPVSGRGKSIRRAVADMAVTMLTIIMAIVWMQGIGTIAQKLGWVGPFTEIAQIVPVLLIGLGVDYGIHLISRYREEVGEGQSVERGIQRAIGTSGVALTLATLTTVIGFLTNVVNPVPALKDFGILAAIGIFASFVLMLTFVPSLRLVLDRRAESQGTLPVEGFRASSEERLLPRIMEKTAVLAERLAIPTLVVMLALGALGAYGLSQLETRFSFTDFLPADSPIVETFNILDEEFGGGFGETTQVLVTAPEGGDLATPEVYNAVLAVRDNLVSTENVITIPTPFGDVAQATDPVGVFQQLLAPAAPGQPPANLDLATQAVALGLSQDGSVGEGADVAGLWDLAAEAAGEQMTRVRHVDETGAVDAIQIEIGTQAGERGAGQLREDLITALEPLTSIDGVTAVPTSQQIISDVVVGALSESQVSSLLYTIIAATIVLVINFWFENRRPFLGVLTMIPVALVVLWTFGLMFVSGIPFGPVTATLAALAVGIGVPYTIHLARRFEEDRNRFDDIEAAIRSTTRHTGGALAGSAFTTAAGFGILVTSTLTPF
ncbi:MAG: MMPL family transporter, partial [Acidimicrobiia bacterium]|nr:MMPL family transporter [Acidimicrobiia bacterium]